MSILLLIILTIILTYLTLLLIISIYLAVILIFLQNVHFNIPIHFIIRIPLLLPEAIVF